MAVLLTLFSLLFAAISSSDVAAMASENLDVYYYGNASAPFEYLEATITIPSNPLPALDGQFLYYYVGLSKQQLSAVATIVFCGTKGGCWDGTLPTGYSFYAELNDYTKGRGKFLSGAKVAIEPGKTVDLTIIQSGTYLSVNMTRPSDGKDSYFDIYGANDGGLVDVIAGLNLQYDSNQKEICDDYSKMPMEISDIVAVETGGVNVENIDFKQDSKDNNSCRGVIEVGAKGKSLKIIGAKE